VRVERETSFQLQSQVLRLEVCIPLEHSQVLVPCDSSNLHYIEALLKEPRSGLVSKVMESQITDTSPRACSSPSTLQRLIVEGNNS
jgi:hypothetical protein